MKLIGGPADGREYDATPRYRRYHVPVIDERWRLDLAIYVASEDHTTATYQGIEDRT